MGGQGASPSIQESHQNVNLGAEFQTIQANSDGSTTALPQNKSLYLPAPHHKSVSYNSTDQSFIEADAYANMPRKETIRDELNKQESSLLSQDAYISLRQDSTEGDGKNRRNEKLAPEDLERKQIDNAVKYLDQIELQWKDNETSAKNSPSTTPQHDFTLPFEYF